MIEYLRQQPEVEWMQSDTSARFLEHWLDALAQTTAATSPAIGCMATAPPVYLAEQLSAQFASHWSTLCRHREFDGICMALHVIYSC